MSGFFSNPGINAKALGGTIKVSFGGTQIKIDKASAQKFRDDLNDAIQDVIQWEVDEISKEKGHNSNERWMP